MSGRLERKPILGFQINRSHPLAKGIVALWLVNEGSGATIFDVSGNGYSATYSDLSGFDWVAGRDGWAIDKNGPTNSGFTTSSTIQHNIGTGDFTWEAWVMPQSISASFLGISGNGAFSPSFNTILGSEPNWGIFWSSSRPSGNTLIVDIWYHLVILRQNGTIKFYQDAIQTPTTHTVTLSMANAVHWLAVSGFSTEVLDGLLNKYTFYNRALTSKEIWSLYTEPYAIFKKSPYGRIFGPAAAGNLTISVIDNISLSERVLHGKGQIIRDNITVSERVLEGIGLIVAETISATEGLSAGKGQIILDTITVAELVQFGKGLIVIDDITLGEKITQGKGQILRDAITVAEKILQGKGQIVRDTISVAEDITAVLTTVGGLEVSENEVITMSELVQLGKGQITRDAVSVAEKIVLGKGQIVRDTVTLTEKILTGKGQIIIDTITVSEAVTAVLSPLLISINETITVTDIATVVRSSLAAVTQKIMFMLELAKIRMFSLELDQVPQFKLALEKKPQFKLEI